MLDIMDTYNHDDMHHQYGKNENYNNISIMMNRTPKKVIFRNLIEELRVFLTLLMIRQRKIYSITYIVLNVNLISRKSFQ